MNHFAARSTCATSAKRMALNFMQLQDEWLLQQSRLGYSSAQSFIWVDNSGVYGRAIYP